MEEEFVVKIYDYAYQERKRKILETEEGMESEEGQRILAAMEKRERRKIRNRQRDEYLRGK